MDKSRDRSLGGNGLGLSLVKKIVELHGGIVYPPFILQAYDKAVNETEGIFYDNHKEDNRIGGFVVCFIRH